MEIIQDIIPAGRRNRPGIFMVPKYITIHDSRNLKEGADAEAHANFLKNGAAGIPASWHFTVDHDSIVQHLPLNESALHAGDGRNGPGNLTSIAVEITENPDGDRAKAEASAAELVASLLKQFNLGIDRVVQHNHWSGKDCPKVLRRPGGWESFLKAVLSHMKPKTEMDPRDAQTVADILGNVYSLFSTASVSQESKNEIHRLANEVRKAGGLPPT